MIDPIESRDAYHLDFSAEEAERYSRHILLPNLGPRGQARLRASKALVIGAGGLGSPSLLYLAAAGVGTIRVVDFDRVDLSNLQRQVMHDTGSLGISKARSAEARMKAINPALHVEVAEEAFSEANCRNLVRGMDVVLDGCDNFTTRYLANDACFLEKVPLVSASVFRFEGQLTSFSYADGTPCYRCIYPSPPPAGAVPPCSEAGVLGSVVGMLGTMQATEAIKLVAGLGLATVGRLLRVDAMSMRMDDFEVERDPKCPLCGDTPNIREARTIESEGCA